MDSPTVNKESIWEDIWELGGNPPGRTALTSQLYRYVDEEEYTTIRDLGYIQTRGNTWLTPNNVDKAAEAEQFLALSHPPGYRIGPVWALDVVIDGYALRISPPRYGRPGGAWEVTTTRRIPYGERHEMK